MEEINKITELWNNENYKCGGFYEIAMQLRSSKKVTVLLEKLFEIENVHGPFDSHLEIKKLDLENVGILEFNGKQLPFRTHFISTGKGNNWLYISIYTAILEKILGNEFQTWGINGNELTFNEKLDQFLIEIARTLNTVSKIEIGVLGFEVSGMYNIDWLTENELTKNDLSFSRFFINDTDLDKMHMKNKSKVTIL